MNIKDRNKLYRQIRVGVGEGTVRDFSQELTDDVIATQIEIAIEDYISKIQDWLTLQQWSSLDGLSINEANFVDALTVKSLDFEKQFAASYGKQTGIGTIGKWELKKDYIVVSAHTQTYSIPAKREINDVLWNTPPQVGTGNSDPFMGGNWTAGAYGWYGGVTPASALLPTFTLLLSTQDRNQKKKILQSELTYNITPGPDGTKNLHLMPIPGSISQMTGTGFFKQYEGSKVWYFYYDTNSKGRDKCLELNTDIVKMPFDVPYMNIPWDKLNLPAKNKIRMLATAYCKKFLANVRGVFSGKIKGVSSGDDLQMDYAALTAQADKELDAIYLELKEYLDEMSYHKIMEKRASIGDSLNKILSNTPSIQPFWLF
jgi:hypothetical protein